MSTKLVSGTPQHGLMQDPRGNLPLTLVDLVTLETSGNSTVDDESVENVEEELRGCEGEKITGSQPGENLQRFTFQTTEVTGSTE